MPFLAKIEQILALLTKIRNFFVKNDGELLLLNELTHISYIYIMSMKLKGPHFVHFRTFYETVTCRRAVPRHGKGKPYW